MGETVTDLSQRLLAHHGGLRGLFRMDIAELARLRGLGDAKSIRLKAALELGRRLAALSPVRLVCALRLPMVLLSGVMSRIASAFLLKKDCGSPRLLYGSIVLSHSLAGRTFTAEE